MRQSGILMPVSALPGAYGIGSFSKEAYKFVDWLQKSGQSLWQILPLGPTSYGDSPYQSFSTFAGNPYFIDLETLAREGLLEDDICRQADFGNNPNQIDYGMLYQNRFHILKVAYEHAKEQQIMNSSDYVDFLNEQNEWLSDYALYMSVKDYFHGAGWNLSHLIPACDISEQISLASKEASGTGNMKFMLNGAVTLGTMDGANVEICNLVGKDNIYIFGKSSQEVIQLYETSGYHSDQYYDNDPLIQNLVDFIISKEMIRIGDPENLCRLYKDLISKDWFMTLLDLKEYIAVKENVMADYEGRMNWAGKMLINTAKAGYFSSDRTIAEYNRDIWKL